MEGGTSTQNIVKYEEDIYKKIKVDKLIDLQLDLGTLLAVDSNDLDLKKLRSDKKDAYLSQLARDDTQLLLNAIWELETERVDGYIVAKLPKPATIVPREKPIPKPKPLTKWQQFVKEKGIKPKKKSNLSWDEVLKKWVPRYGFKRSQAEKEKDWIIEVPNNVDPYTDMFEKKAQIKQEKVSKNEFQRLRNLAKAKNIKVPSMGLPPTSKMTAKQLNTAAQTANVSTASLGKFQPRLSKEKHLSKASILVKRKRKLPPPGMEDEHKRNLKIADSLLNKKPKLDLDKAVNREIFHQESAVAERKSEEKERGKGRGRGKGKGKGRGGKGEKKAKSGGGNHKQFKKGAKGGRKRR